MGCKKRTSFSCNAGLASAIMEKITGRGVDAIINSLAGSLFKASC